MFGFCFISAFSSEIVSTKVCLSSALPVYILIPLGTHKKQLVSVSNYARSFSKSSQQELFRLIPQPQEESQCRWFLSCLFRFPNHLFNVMDSWDCYRQNVMWKSSIQGWNEMKSQTSSRFNRQTANAFLFSLTLYSNLYWFSSSRLLLTLTLNLFSKISSSNPFLCLDSARSIPFGCACDVIQRYIYAGLVV